MNEIIRISKRQLQMIQRLTAIDALIKAADAVDQIPLAAYSGERTAAVISKQKLLITEYKEINLKG